MIYGAAAVGIGALVGAGIAVFSNRIVEKSRVAHELSSLNETIDGMKVNIQTLEKGWCICSAYLLFNYTAVASPVMLL